MEGRIMSRVFHFSFSTTDPRVIKAIFRSVYKDCDRKMLRKVVVAALQDQPEKTANLAPRLAASCGTQFDVLDLHLRFTSSDDVWRRFCLRRMGPKNLCISIASKERAMLFAPIRTIEALVGTDALLSVCDHPESLRPHQAREFLAVGSAAA